MSRDPIVINLLAGSGAGKSTNAARIFAMLKDKGVETELVTEYVKPMVWEGRSKVFDCQPYIFGKQLYKLVQVQDSVDVIVTDSPIILSSLYDKEQDPDFRRYVIRKFNEYQNMNYFLRRVKPFNPNGRNEKTIEEALAKDEELRALLNSEDILFTEVPGDAQGCDIIVQRVLERIAINHRLKNNYNGGKDRVEEVKV